MSPDNVLSLSDSALQFQPAKQLCIRSHDDGGEAHSNCTNAHGQIESPSDKNASCDWYGDKGLERTAGIKHTTSAVTGSRANVTDQSNY